MLNINIDVVFCHLGMCGLVLVLVLVVAAAVMQVASGGARGNVDNNGNDTNNRNCTGLTG